MDDIKSLNEKVDQLELRVTALETLLVGKKHETEAKLPKKLSIKEFILLKKPSGDVEKSLAVAYYLEKHEDMNSFNVEDLGNYYGLAKEPTPANLNDKINMNIRKGHLIEAKEKKNGKKAWIITNTGEQFVENNFKERK